MKCIYKFLIFIISATLSVTMIFSEQTDIFADDTTQYNFSSETAILVDLDRGQQLLKKDENKQVYDPILPKLMTALLAIENIKPTTLITVSTNAAASMTDGIELKAGEKYSVEDLLSATFLTSSYTSTYALAEYMYSNNISRFVDSMNAKAETLNMINTKFTDPAGYLDPTEKTTSYTTAADIALFMKYALANTTFYDYFISPTRQVKVEVSPTGLIKSRCQIYDYSDYSKRGGKVASPTAGKVSSVIFAANNTRKLLVVLLNMDSAVAEGEAPRYITESKSVLDYGFQFFQKGLLLSKDQIVKTVEVAGEALELVTLEDVYYTYPINNSNYIVKSEENILTNLTPPIEQGAFCGSIKYYLKDNTVITVPLQAKYGIFFKTSAFNHFMDKLTENKALYDLVIVLLLAEGCIIVFYLSRFIYKKVNRNKPKKNS